MAEKESTKVAAKHFPEIGVGGFTSLDGTIEFYTRINTLLKSDMTILEFGAGRGANLVESDSNYKRQLMTLRGKVTKVIACDIDEDEVVLTNPGADEAVVIRPDFPLPFADDAFDVIVSDFVFEHIANPALTSTELQRILKPGGWICARTPNKYCLIAMLTRLIRNSKHSRILRWVQPERQSIDVFPTVYKMNSKNAIENCFPKEVFDNFTYRYEAEPSYYFNNRMVFALMLLINKLSPAVMKSGLFVFLRKQ